MISLHFLAGMQASDVSIVVDNAKRPIIGSETELSRRCQRKASAVTMAKSPAPCRGSSGDLLFMSASTPTSRTTSTKTTLKSSSSKRATLSSHTVLTSWNSSSSYIMSTRLPGGQSHCRRRTSSTSFVDVTDSLRKTKVAEAAKEKQHVQSIYLDSFRVWNDNEEKKLGTKDHRNVVETSILAKPIVGVHNNRTNPGSPLRVRKQQVPQHRQSPTLTQKVIRMDRKTAKRPTPPRRRERLHRRETPPNTC
jgi:hypothetical protein